MEVNLLIIATNKYTCFLNDLLDSAYQNFLKDDKVTYHIFTDQVHEINYLLEHKEYYRHIIVHEIEHKPYPYTTLYRFHFFKKYKKKLGNPDAHFYVDADCKFELPITKDEIISSRTAVQHCGYVGERGTYETNPESSSYVAENEGDTYFGGGFWGFQNDEFWKLVDTAIKMIDSDEKKGIVPVWHDESVLNRYLIDNLPTKILTPSFHYPENHQHIQGKWLRAGLSFECKVLLLNKNHNELR